MQNLAVRLSGVIEARADEIRGYVATNNLPDAVRRLQDFVEEFSLSPEQRRDLKNEAVKSARRVNALLEEKRKGTLTPTELDVKSNQITDHLLTTIDSLVDAMKQESATSPEKSNLVVLPKPAPAPHLGTPSDKVQSPRANAPAEPAKALDYDSERERFTRRPDSGAIFWCRDVHKRLGTRGNVAFHLQDIQLELLPQQITGVVGKNGAGKTTLLRIIGGELGADHGSFGYPALSANRIDWPVIKEQIALVPQELKNWNGTAEQLLKLTAALGGIKGQENEDEVAFILHRLGLARYREYRWSELSGGFKMRFALASALLNFPRLLILDEPLAPLDVVTQQLFIRDLRDLANSHFRNMHIVVSSQHLYEVESFADNIVVIEDGHPVYAGPVKALGADKTHNQFEISLRSSESLVRLSNRLGKLQGFTVDANGTSTLVTAPRSTSSADLLSILVEESVDIVHFRDISDSSRRFFANAMDD